MTPYLLWVDVGSTLNIRSLLTFRKAHLTRRGVANKEWIEQRLEGLREISP